MLNSYTDASGVYRNKLGIENAEQLKRVEYDITTHRSREILEQDSLGSARGFGLERQQAIHRHLFQDVYEWAGKTRTVPLSKQMENGMVSVFANPDTLEQSWQELERKTKAFVHAKGLAFEQKRDALTDIFIEANRIHPFPEGNGRSLQVFMKELAREQGVELNYEKTSAKEWNLACGVSGTYGRLIEQKYLIPNPPDPEPIRRIFVKIASPSRELGQVPQRGPARQPSRYEPKAI